MWLSGHLKLRNESFMGNIYLGENSQSVISFFFVYAFIFSIVFGNIYLGENSQSVISFVFLYAFIFSILFIHYLFALQAAKSCFVPALLGHAIDDDFIQPHHSDRILEAYMVSIFYLKTDLHN